MLNPITLLPFLSPDYIVLFAMLCKSDDGLNDRIINGWYRTETDTNSMTALTGSDHGRVSQSHPEQITPICGTFTFTPLLDKVVR